jgi:GT2 family glycosyltransferase
MDAQSTRDVPDLLPKSRMAIGIATSGRPNLLAGTLQELAKQIRHPERIIICASAASDVEHGAELGQGTELVFGKRGSSYQRNEIIARADDIDILVFFDDDFLPDPAYLQIVEQVFLQNEEIVLVTGALIADGIKGPGFAIDEARTILSEDRADREAKLIEEVPNGYGCNMAIRLAPVRTHKIWFDPKLPLYAWLEDLDFSSQLARHGRVVRASAARGVHLGVKQGRQPGRRLGYSQVANPIYLARKGTCPWKTSLKLIAGNILANTRYSVRPEPYIDRFGRLSGNAIALVDLLKGQLDPERVLEL